MFEGYVLGFEFLISDFSMIQDRLLEIMLLIILMFNAGAYIRIEKKAKDMKNRIERNSDTIDRLAIRIFGVEEDPTSEGHLMETQERFEKLNESIERVCRKIDKIDERRREEYTEVRGQIHALIEEVSKEEGIDIEKEDIQKKTESFSKKNESFK